MTMNIRSVLQGLGVAITVMLVGCEQDLNLDKYKDPGMADTLVVNSILNPDSVIAVSVTRPYFFSDTHVAFSPVQHLDVEVITNASEAIKLEYNPLSDLYETSMRPRAGEKYEVSVRDAAKIAYSCDTVPRKVDIKNIEVYAEGPIHIFWDRDYRFTYRITFQDNPGSEDYYFLSIEDDAPPYEFTQMGTVDYTTDYVFQVLANTVNQSVQGWKPDGVFGYPFSDKGIEGREYTITVNEVLQSPLVSMIDKLPRRVNLYSISKAYYTYMVSVLSLDYEESAIAGNLLSLGLMEPARIYSNISGGAGLMGSYNLSTMRVDLLSESGGWPR